MHGERGQLVAYDLFFAMAIFFVALAVLQLVWLESIETERAEGLALDMKNRAAEIADVLTMKAGYPYAWEDDIDSAELIGLAYAPRKLSAGKLAALADPGNYEKIKETMGLQYDFSAEISRDSNILYKTAEKSAGSMLIVAQRAVDYEGENALFVLKLYK